MLDLTQCKIGIDHDQIAEIHSVLLYGIQTPSIQPLHCWHDTSRPYSRLIIIIPTFSIDGIARQQLIGEMTIEQNASAYILPRYQIRNAGGKDVRYEHVRVGMFDASAMGEIEHAERGAEGRHAERGDGAGYPRAADADVRRQRAGGGLYLVVAVGGGAVRRVDGNG